MAFEVKKTCVLISFVQVRKSRESLEIDSVIEVLRWLKSIAATLPSKNQFVKLETMYKAIGPDLDSQI